MPIEHQVWKIGESPKPLEVSTLVNENELEDMIFKDMNILSPDWLLIGRQVKTAFGKLIDLLAMDASGSIIIIELKKNMTPREVVAQALDYASWVKELNSNEIAEIFEQYGQSFHEVQSVDEAFFEKFKIKLLEENLNSSHQMVIVASMLDSSTERIITYLNDYNIPINVVFFQVFKDQDERYLSRAWLMDPATVQEHATAKRESEPWNGEYYVSFGHEQGRDWEDARKYGFISAGGGKWYTQTLNKLHKGDRIWVNIPHTGYVGVGIVTGPPTIIDNFFVEHDGEEVPFTDAPRNASYLIEYIGNEDKSEFFVPVKWIKDIPVNEAISEIGFFGNQNTVAQPTSPKWQFTIERLKEALGVE